MTISPDMIRARREEEAQPLVDVINEMLSESDGESEVSIHILHLIDRLKENGYEPDEDPFNIDYGRELDPKISFAIKRVFERVNWKVSYYFICERDEDGNIIFCGYNQPCVEHHAFLFVPADVFERRQNMRRHRD